MFKHSRLISLSLVLASTIFATSVSSQPAVHRSHYSGPLLYSYPKLSYFPPLSTSMPFDVLIGYVYLDSMARTVPFSVIDSAIGDYRVWANSTHTGAIGYSDTLRRLAKYLYEVDDYDPVRFSQYCNLWAPGTHYKSGGLPTLIRYLLGAIVRKFPDSMRTALLCGSDYIADVKVTDVLQVADSAAPLYGRTAYMVTCNILDLIKGQTAPDCIPDTFAWMGAHKGARITSTTPTCIQFDYRLETPRLNHGDVITQEDSTFWINGHPWIQKDSEYLVYLRLESLGWDSTNSYATIFPATTDSSKMGGMFPVQGGIVYDPYDEMGFGSGLSVADYKSKLRAKIQSILKP